LKELIVIYKNPWILKYIQRRVGDVSHVVTNTEKLELSIYKKISRYIEYQGENKISNFRVRKLVEKEISEAIKKFRLQKTTSYSELAVTNGFGESLEYEPEDEVTDVEKDVEQSALQRKIARLASDDFERYVLTAWSRGERSIDIAKDLAVLGTHDVAYFKLKVARFKSRCKKRWTKETFVSC